MASRVAAQKASLTLERKAIFSLYGFMTLTCSKAWVEVKNTTAQGQEASETLVPVHTHFSKEAEAVNSQVTDAIRDVWKESFGLNFYVPR